MRIVLGPKKSQQLVKCYLNKLRFSDNSLLLRGLNQRISDCVAYVLLVGEVRHV